MSKCYKYCVVPLCTNTSIKTPQKKFFNVPKDSLKRKKWCLAMRRMHKSLSLKSTLYCCEDHFVLQEDMENYWEHRLTPGVRQLLLKPNVVPHIFTCQNQKGEVKNVPQNDSALIQFGNESENAPSISVDTGSTSVTNETILPSNQIKVEIDSPSRDGSPLEYVTYEDYEEQVLPDPLTETASESNNSSSFEDSIPLSKLSIPNKKLKTKHPFKKAEKELQLLSAYSLPSVQFDNSKEMSSHPVAKPREIRYDLLGRNWAEKMKTLRRDQRIFAEKLINDVLYEAEWCHLNHGCRIQNSG